MSVTPGSSSSYFARPFALGWLGVDLLFLISGYLIGSIIIKSGNAKNFRTVFFFRLACRILPVYLLLLCLYAWCSRTEPDHVGQLFGQAVGVERLWPLAWVPCAISASPLVAHASIVWNEQPLMRLGRRMTYRVKLVGASFASEKDEARE